MTEHIPLTFDEARDLFPHAGKVAYFNSASYGPFCRPVADAIEENVAIRVSADEDDSHTAFGTRAELRKIYAGFIGAAEHEVGVGSNTSFGLNIAAFGLPLAAGDEILVSDVEFPAVIYTFRAAAEARGLTLTFVPSTGRTFDIEALEAAISDRTRVIALSWVQFFNGFKLDLAAIGALCRKHDIYFVVDGIQGMGVEPIDVGALGIDIFSSGCQKWMLAPQGCGFFYLSEKVMKQLTMPFMSWLGVDWKMDFTDLFKYDLPWIESAARFELGYYAVLNILAMRAACDLFSRLGIARIQRHNYDLIDRLADYVDKSDYYQITSSMKPLHRSSIFTFSCRENVELHRYILKRKIILVRREGSIRVSVHLFNNEDDIDRLIETLEDFRREKS